jgi:hypothetical protein
MTSEPLARRSLKSPLKRPATMGDGRLHNTHEKDGMMVRQPMMIPTSRAIFDRLKLLHREKRFFDFKAGFARRFMLMAMILPLAVVVAGVLVPRMAAVPAGTRLQSLQDFTFLFDKEQLGKLLNAYLSGRFVRACAGCMEFQASFWLSCESLFEGSVKVVTDRFQSPKTNKHGSETGGCHEDQNLDAPGSQRDSPGMRDQQLCSRGNLAVHKRAVMLVTVRQIRGQTLR